MKTPKTLIKEYEHANGVNGSHLRLYTYVRPRPSGEATIEVWGAMNHRRRKNHPLVIKQFFVFRTDEDGYKTRDTLWYTSYSMMVHDHVCYHFPEAAGDNYKYNLGKMAGEWGWCRMKDTSEAHLPIYATMLNGWDGTNYKYCGYDATCGMPLMSYLELWRKYPKSEIVSKTKMFQLLDKRFLNRFENETDFAKYVFANRGTIALHHMGSPAIETAFKRKKTCEEYMNALHERRKARDEAERLRIEEEKRKEREEEMKRMKKWDRKMKRLYNRIKSICGTYGCFEVEVPKSSAEMYAESDAMENCVGRCYTSNHAMGHDVIIFLRKDGKPCVDMRIDPKKMEIVECRYRFNKDAMHDKEVMDEAVKVRDNFAKVWKEVA